MITFGKDLEWKDNDLIEVLFSICWKDSGNPWKTSVRMTGVPAEIRTKHLPNTSAERYL
jgi:hypothetical protein